MTPKTPNIFFCFIAHKSKYYYHIVFYDFVNNKQSYFLSNPTKKRVFRRCGLTRVSM